MQLIVVTRAAYQSLSWQIPFSELAALAKPDAGISVEDAGGKPLPKTGSPTEMFNVVEG